MTRRKRSHVALYGTVAIPRVYCGACEAQAFVIDGKMACCGVLARNERVVGIVREVESDDARKKPSPAAQKAILERQENRCLYCERTFGTLAIKAGKTTPTRLRVEWDHLIPFAYSRSCADDAFVAACQICNGIKGDQIFQTLDEARARIQLRRDAKGWTS